MYLLFSVFCTPAQGSTFSPPVTSFSLECCLWHSCSAHLPAMNSLISPYFTSVPGGHSLGAGSWWTVSIFQHHCSWVPGSNHFKGNGKLLWLLLRFSFPLWFLILISDDVAGSFLLFMLSGVHQSSCICTPMSPTTLGNCSAILCPLLGLWSQSGRCLLIFHSCHLHPTIQPT